MSKKLNKNKFLPLIKLKYYILPDKSEKHEPSGISCCICLKKNIVNVAGVFYNEDGKTHHICEDCAVHRYKEENNFNSFKIAYSHRRRLFDVGYLFNEIVIDEYIKFNKINGFKDLKNPEDIFIKITSIYNELFSKEEKEWLEKIELQEDIEKKLREKIWMINIGNI